MADLSPLGILVAFAAGGISFLSPCVLPLVPGYVSYVAGHSAAGPPAPRRTRTIALSLCFVLGFSIVFMIMGAAATAIGQWLLRFRYELGIAGGLVVIVFGLFVLGVASLPVLQRDVRLRPELPGGRPLSAGVLGMAFGFGWTPCIGPVLGTILTMSAVSATLEQGLALLAVYSAGLGIPFLLVAAFADRTARRLHSVRTLGRRLNQVAGLLMIVMGVAMMTGQLTVLSYWLLDAFPALGRIG